MTKRIEYLVVSSDNPTFCTTSESLIDFLCHDTRINVNKEEKTILFQNEISKKKSEPLSVNYNVETGIVEDLNHRYFHIILETKLVKNKVDQYIELANIVIELCKSLPGEITVNTLWNDVFKDYSIEGYKLIFKVENLLRRFITKLLVVNMGAEWVNELIPDEVINRDGKDVSNTVDFLHQIYLSDLETIIFKGQRKKGFRNMEDVQKIIRHKIIKKEENISISDLEGFISKSIWDKYFVQNNPKLEKGKLQKNLTELNKLRNDVAHNRFITSLNFYKIKRITKEIEEALELAFDVLPRVKIEQEDKFVQLGISTSDFLLEQKIVKAISLNDELKIIKEPTFRLIDILVQDKKGKKIGIEFNAMSNRNFYRVGKQIITAINKYELDKFIYIYGEVNVISGDFLSGLRQYLRLNRINNYQVELIKVSDFNVENYFD